MFSISIRNGLEIKWEGQVCYGRRKNEAEVNPELQESIFLTRKVDGTALCYHKNFILKSIAIIIFPT